MKQKIYVALLMLILLTNGQFQFPLTEANHVHAEQEIQIKTEQEERVEHSVFNTKLIELASEGKLSEVEFPIGTNINNIIAENGTPNEQGVWGGSNYFAYDNVIYFVPFDEDVVTSIEVYLSSAESLPLNDVESFIGSSTSGREISELDNRSFLLYELDSFILYIEADSENVPVETLFLKQS